VDPFGGAATLAGLHPQRVQVFILGGEADPAAFAARVALLQRDIWTGVGRAVGGVPGFHSRRNWGGLGCLHWQSHDIDVYGDEWVFQNTKILPNVKIVSKQLFRAGLPNCESERR
jgi:hypothetical protein